MIKLFESSAVRRDKMLRAERLRLILWQADHPLGGPREDVCPIVATYYEDDVIYQLTTKETDTECYLIAASQSNTILAGLAELLKVEVITPILQLLKSHPLKSERNRAQWRSI